MEPRLIPIKDLAEAWGISVRQMQMYCKAGRLPGAKKIGNLWVVPENSSKPEDYRLLVGSSRKRKNKEDEYTADTKNSKEMQIVNKIFHNIRTSVSNVRGCAEIIFNHSEDRERIEQNAINIQRISGDMVHMMDNLIYYDRLMNVKKLKEKVYNIEGILNEVIQQESDSALHKNIKIIVKSNIEHELVYTDKEKLKKALGNVLNNAIKFSGNGEAVQIRLEEIPVKNAGITCVRYIIEDHGIGMSEELVNSIYSTFYTQTMASPKSWNGSGLGMEIVKQIVELLDGNLKIESQTDFGTRVAITINHRQADIPYADNEYEDVSQLADFKGKRILVAEDNAINREIAKEMLLDYGFEVDCAEDGIICVAKLEMKEPGYYDYILMDLWMPNLDGFDATRLIRGLSDKVRALTPVIATTASVTTEDKQKAINVGMDGFVGKPVNMNNLIKVMSKCNIKKRKKL